MQLYILRLFDEWIDLKETGKVPVTSFKSIGVLDENNADMIAMELSKKESGVFFIQQPMKIDRTMNPTHLFMEERREEGAPEYSIFKAGYQNGKKVFPKIGQAVVPSIEE